MNIVLNDIVDKRVYPILIKNGGNDFLTLYYYHEKDDSILHNASHLIYFSNYGELKTFCVEHSLIIAQNPCIFDFDASIINPTDYKSTLENWNLLNTISNIFQMYFEGNHKKHTALYNLLFRYNTSITEVPNPITLNEKNNRQLLKVFKKKNRLLNRFISINQLKGEEASYEIRHAVHHS